MLDNDNFVELYIADSIKNGYMSPKEICGRVLSELDEIDKKIRETNQLRVHYKNLKQVLRSFNYDIARKSTINYNPIEKLNISNKFIEIIRNFIESQNKPVTAREIIDNAGNREQHQEIYMSIKYMCDNGILTRKEDRMFIAGPNFKNIT